MSRLRVLATVALVVATVAAACSGSSSPPRDGAGSGAPSSQPQSQPETRAPRAVDRILVLSSAGDLFTIAPDGTDRLDLSQGSLAQQPAWSHTAQRVGWVEVSIAGLSVVTSGVDGGSRTAAAIAGPPIYLAWAPTAERLAYLAAGRTGIDLGVVDVGTGGFEATRIGSGQPFFVSWGPTGEQVLTHVGAGLLATVDLTGRRTPLPDTGGNFRAPQWGGDGQLVYAVEARSTQQLVVQESVGEPPRAVLDFEGFIEFRLSPSGDRIAYQVTFLAGGDGGPSQQFQLAASQSPPTALPGVLTVLDLDTGTVTEVSRGATRGFFWRPDGEALLFIEDEGPRLRWQVWDGAESGRFSAFAPTVTYAQAYLPFFDQFAQAVSPWSPDGTRFVYTAVDGTGEAGVWVQEISGEPPRRVASGEVGFWSPR